MTTTDAEFVDQRARSCHFSVVKTICTIWVVCLLGCWPTTGEPPALGSISVQAHGRSSLVVAGAAGGTPLIRQLAQAFRAESGVAVQVESPIGGDGSRLALEDNRLDGAIVVQDSTVPIATGCTIVAHTPVVVAIGPAINARTLSTKTLIDIIAGTSRRWASGVQKKFILRTAHDPVLKAYTQDDSPLATTIKEALRERRWPIVYSTDDPAQRVGTRPGAVGLAMLGNLRLRGIPVWTTRLSDHPAPRLNIVMCVGQQPPQDLSDFMAYIQSEAGQQLVADRGFAVGGENMP